MTVSQLIHSNMIGLIGISVITLFYFSMQNVLVYTNTWFHFPLYYTTLSLICQVVVEYILTIIV